MGNFVHQITGFCCNSAQCLQKIKCHSFRLDGVERVLCDNFSIADLAQAVRLSNGKLPLEASGNIDENTILAVAKTGVPKMIYSRLFSLPQALIEKPSASQLNRKDRSIA
jgi:nicotinate-nucleotide pyrophosphorylase